MKAREYETKNGGVKQKQSPFSDFRRIFLMQSSIDTEFYGCREKRKYIFLTDKIAPKGFCVGAILSHNILYNYILFIFFFILFTMSTNGLNHIVSYVKYTTLHKKKK